MNDFEDLTAWIRPRHLSVSAVDAYRADFEGRSPQVLHLTDFLQPDTAARLARFLGWEATYDQVYCLYSAQKEAEGNWVSAENWQAAAEDNRWYTHGMLTGPDPRFRLSPNLFTFMDFRKVIATSAFRAYLSAVTGLPLGEMEGGKVHRMRPGDIIKPHDDGAGGRRLTFIFYLSPTWKPEYGGALHIVGKNNQRSETEATFNSLVLFDLTTQKFHYVTAIPETAGDHARLAVAGWFRGPESR